MTAQDVLSPKMRGFLTFIEYFGDAFDSTVAAYAYTRSAAEAQLRYAITHHDCFEGFTPSVYRRVVRAMLHVGSSELYLDAIAKGSIGLISAMFDHTEMVEYFLLTLRGATTKELQQRFHLLLSDLYGSFILFSDDEKKAEEASLLRPLLRFAFLASDVRHEGSDRFLSSILDSPGRHVSPTWYFALGRELMTKYPSQTMDDWYQMRYKGSRIHVVLLDDLVRLRLWEHIPEEQRESPALIWPLHQRNQNAKDAYLISVLTSPYDSWLDELLPKLAYSGTVISSEPTRDALRKFMHKERRKGGKHTLFRHRLWVSLILREPISYKKDWPYYLTHDVQMHREAALYIARRYIELNTDQIGIPFYDYIVSQVLQAESDVRFLWRTFGSKSLSFGQVLDIHHGYKELVARQQDRYTRDLSIAGDITKFPNTHALVLYMYKLRKYKEARKVLLSHPKELLHLLAKIASVDILMTRTRYWYDHLLLSLYDAQLGDRNEILAVGAKSNSWSTTSPDPRFWKVFGGKGYSSYEARNRKLLLALSRRKGWSYTDLRSLYELHQGVWCRSLYVALKKQVPSFTDPKDVRSALYDLVEGPVYM